MGAVSTGIADNFRFKAVAMAVLVLAMCMASSPTVAGQSQDPEPIDFCDFYLGYTGKHTWRVIRPRQKGDKMYLYVGTIRHWVNNKEEKVKVANSKSCMYAECPTCTWEEVKCSHVFYTNEAWVSTRTFNGNNLDRFLNKYVKVVFSAAQYRDGGRNYNSNGNVRDCLMFKTGNSWN
eukprot:TRINITY_DN2960_c2_g1_i1.p1 TRINITY_DN2960_c2_g1~~TRINITY_DN2960_c2_g1_i1.p1  ORF type:complete len:177 (+),score=16.48 TRINITY_DN2960_c2_g1_i1:205-735(+)